MWSTLPFARSLQHEDLAIAGWFVVGEPLFQWLLGLTAAGADFWSLGRDTPHHELLGLLFCGAVLAAAVALATRTSSDPDVMLSPESPVGYAYFPMMVSFLIVATTGMDLLQVPFADRVIGLAPLFVLLALALHKWLPAIPGAARRVLMMPLILVCSWIFSDTLGPLSAGILGLGQSGGASVLQALWATCGLIGLFAAAFYMMFIFAPRQIVNRETEWGDWSVRFVVYFVGLLANLVMPRLLAGG